jgi:hypothetical protein
MGARSIHFQWSVRAAAAAFVAWTFFFSALARAERYAEWRTLVDRRPIVARGEGRLTMGAGTWLRETTNITVGHLDLRIGATEHVEVRILLPGIAFEALHEREGLRPALVLYGGLCEVGFNSVHGATLAYQVGARVTKQLHSRVRLSGLGELRHRMFGGPNAELAIAGPLPSARAFLLGGELALQLFEGLAFVGTMGFAAALDEGRSFGYGSAGLVASIRYRLDLYAHAFLERSRPDRALAPAVFGGVGLRF